MNKKVDLTSRLMTFVIDSMAIIVLSLITIAILGNTPLRPLTIASIGQLTLDLLHEDEWLYWWIIQLATALGYHYVAWSVWNASPAQHFTGLKLVGSNEKNLPFIQFLFRLLLKTMIINIPLLIFIFDGDLFLLSGLIYLGILIIGGKMIDENAKGQMFHGLISNSHFVYIQKNK